jgi:hypothetical protein
MSVSNQQDLMKRLLANLARNDGDELESVKLWKARLAREDVIEQDDLSLRDRLLSVGIGHSFFEGYMWMVPVDGRTIDEVDLNQAVSRNFRRWEQPEVAIVENLTSDEIWFQLGLVLLRDAIRYALKEKGRQNRNLIIRKLTVFDKTQVITSGTYSQVVAGLTLSRIFRINGNNVALAPHLIYECFDTLYKRVDDEFERHRYMTPAARCNAMEWLRRLEKVARNVFPLTVKLSDKTLIFKSHYAPLQIKEVGEKEEVTLEKWFE